MMIGSLIQYLLFLCLLAAPNTLYVRLANGSAIISPSPRVEVCDNGGRFEVTCNTSGSALQWNLNFTTQIGMTSTIAKVLSSTTAHDQTDVFDSIVFRFSRTSELRATPLVSTLTISQSVNSVLNGTQISCMEFASTDPPKTTTVYIIIRGSSTSLMVDYEEVITTEGVVVDLHWTTDMYNPLVSYLVHIRCLQSNESQRLNVSSSTRVNFELAFNTFYNVSVVATVCDEIIATAYVELKYVTCPQPVDEANSTIETDYISPALEGDTVNFTCPSGSNLLGNNYSMCTDNRNWHPDPKNLRCFAENEAFHIDTTNTGTKVNFTTTEMNNVNSNKLNIIVAVTGSLAGLVIIILVIIAIAAVLKQKGLLPSFKVKLKLGTIDNTPNGHDINIDLPQSDHVQERTESHSNSTRTHTQLVYADIGTSFPVTKCTRSSTLELDDTHVEYAQLNHKMDKQALESTSVAQNLNDNVSTRINLDNLLVQLRAQVTPKWYQFGEKVGISHDVLNRYAECCSPDECIVEMLDYWLRNSKTPLSWRDIAEVLEAINLPQLASAIMNVYTTGKLPIEVDVEKITVPQGENKSSRENADVDLQVPPLPPKRVGIPQGSLHQEQQHTLKECPVVPPRPPKP